MAGNPDLEAWKGKCKGGGGKDAQSSKSGGVGSKRHAHDVSKDSHSHDAHSHGHEHEHAEPKACAPRKLAVSKSGSRGSGKQQPPPQSSAARFEEPSARQKVTSTTGALRSMIPNTPNTDLKAKVLGLSAHGSIASSFSCDNDQGAAAVDHGVWGGPPEGQDGQDMDFVEDDPEAAQASWGAVQYAAKRMHAHSKWQEAKQHAKEQPKQQQQPKMSPAISPKPPSHPPPATLVASPPPAKSTSMAAMASANSMGHHLPPPPPPPARLKQETVKVVETEAHWDASEEVAVCEPPEPAAAAAAGDQRAKALLKPKRTVQEAQAEAAEATYMT